MIITLILAISRDTFIITVWSLQCGGRWKYLDVALQVGDKLNMWRLLKGYHTGGLVWAKFLSLLILVFWGV